MFQLNSDWLILEAFKLISKNISTLAYSRFSEVFFFKTMRLYSAHELGMGFFYWGPKSSFCNTVQLLGENWKRRDKKPLSHLFI